MRFAEIGQQLRAYRMESGLRAEEIAARLGVSRAALYRYEKGDVIKLDTVKRMAELLKVSPLSLLGIGVEYYSRASGFFERLRQLEETADQILQCSGPLCYLTTSEAYDEALAESLHEAARQQKQDRSAAMLAADQVAVLLAARKAVYHQRRPVVIAMLSGAAMRRFLERGVLGDVELPPTMRARNQEVARAELLHMAERVQQEAMGLQYGLVDTAEAPSPFFILRGRDRATLSANPFRPDAVPNQQTGVAMITGADEAVAAHQRVAEALWRDAVRGPAAAEAIRAMIPS